GHVVPVGIASVLCREEKEFQIHHVVYDHGYFAVIAGPGFNDARSRSVKGGQGLGGRLDNTHVGWVSADSVSVAVARENLKPYVVVTGVSGLTLQIGGLGFGPCHPGTI